MVEKSFITWSETNLSAAKARSTDPLLAPAYESLIAAADQVLDCKPFSVTHKTTLPPSGDKHDYLSIAPYWWPDPSKPDGLPYIRRDGEFNPASRDSRTDSVRFKEFVSVLESLSLAYYFSDEHKYAEKVVMLLSVWFLDTETLMNPHLEYSQGIAGQTAGRGIGLIDTRNLTTVIDSIIAVDQVLTEQQLQGLRNWFEQYLQWLTTSKNGLEEQSQMNNHGTFYDSQVACIALFLGKYDLAKERIQYTLFTRLPGQFDADGKQPEELQRTRSFHYSAFNLTAYARLAKYGHMVGIELWHADPFNTGSPLLETAITWLASFIAGPTSWQYQEITGIHVLPLGTDGALPVFLQALLEFGKNQHLASALTIAVKEVPGARDWLLWPVTANDLVV
ncbi:alginate lyase-domain-containing protein [Umbelopsis sp. PMI_123]|nr:alginate lyase-domain-containing protein [Umbelopsis sp. PMI_123]